VSDFETIQRRRNVIVGVFVVIGLCALGWLIFKFGDLPIFVGRMGSYEVHVQFPTAAGVQPDTPVRFCGYQVGRVTDVNGPEFMYDKDAKKWYHQTLVVLSIDNHFDIPATAEVKLMTRAMGSSYIEFKVTEKFKVKEEFTETDPNERFLGRGEPGKRGKPAKTLQGSTGVTSEFMSEETQQEMEELAGTLSSFAKKIDAMLSDPNNKSDLKMIVANMADASAEAVARLREAKGTIQNMEKTLQAASKTIGAAEPAIKQFEMLAADGRTTLKKADVHAEKLVTAIIDTSGELARSLSDLRAILGKVNSGQGSAARLLNDGKFYEGLLENAEQMEILLSEITAFVARAREHGLPIRIR